MSKNKPRTTLPEFILIGKNVLQAVEEQPEGFHIKKGAWNNLDSNSPFLEMFGTSYRIIDQSKEDIIIVQSCKESVK